MSFFMIFMTLLKMRFFGLYSCPRRGGFFPYKILNIQKSRLRPFCYYKSCHSIFEALLLLYKHISCILWRCGAVAVVYTKDLIIKSFVYTAATAPQRHRMLKNL